MSSYNNIVKCPSCGGNAELIYASVPDYYFGASGSWDIYRCSALACGVAAPLPTPDDSVLEKAYRHYYTHRSVVDSHAKSKLKAIFARLAYASRNQSFDLWAAHWPILGQLLEEGRLATGAIRPVPGGIIADIGCGSGERLSILKAAGWGRAIGVDRDPEAVADGFRQGRRLELGSAEHLPWPDKSVDAAMMHHVVEHVRKPQKALSEAFRILRPGALLSILTPNIDSAAHQKHGRFWRGLEAPRHLTIFSLRALVSAVRSVGFEVECARTSGRSAAWNDAEALRIKGGIPEQPPLGWVARTFRSDVCFRRQAVSIQEGQQLGDELLVVARRL
jgi:SAM-dependent methyltransferase